MNICGEVKNIYSKKQYIIETYSKVVYLRNYYIETSGPKSELTSIMFK